VAGLGPDLGGHFRELLCCGGVRVGIAGFNTKHPDEGFPDRCKVLAMGRDAFERLMGPAEDILKKEVEDYEKLNRKLIRQVSGAAEAGERPPEGKPDQKGVKLGKQGSQTLAKQGSQTLGKQGSQTLGKQGSQTLVKQGSMTAAEKRARAKSVAAPVAISPSKKTGARYSEV